MKKLIIPLFLTLTFVGGQSVRAMEEGVNKAQVAQSQGFLTYLKDVKKKDSSVMSPGYKEGFVPGYLSWLRSQNSSSSSAAAAAASSTESKCTQCQKAGELVELHGEQMCNDCANAVLGSEDKDASEESDSEQSDHELALKLQAEDEEQIALDFELAKQLDELNGDKELDTDETEGNFNYTRYEYKPTGGVPAVKQLPAIQQKGLTCGVHTAVNAGAINGCLVTGQPVANARSLHGGIYNEAVKKLTKINNLTTQEVVSLGKKLGVENFYVLTTIKPNECIVARELSTQPVKRAVAELKHKDKGAIHFGLHLGGHWVLLSIVKENGRLSLNYMDSNNNKSIRGQYYIRFVHNTFMK